MTVAALPSVVTYIENGVTVDFSVQFRFKSASDLSVSRIAAGIETPLTLGVDYTATGGDTDAGGTLTRTAATNGAQLKIARITAKEQPMEYDANGVFPAKSHEEALDRQMLISQEQGDQLADTATRAVLVPPGEQAYSLEGLATGEGKFLAVSGSRIVPIGIDQAIAGGNPIILASRALLAAVVFPAGRQPATLTEDGFAGPFVAIHDNLAAEVAADPSRVFFVAPNSDPSGASGAWVRQGAGSLQFAHSGSTKNTSAQDKLRQTIDVRDFGAVFDGRDNTAAIQAALDHASAVGGSRTVVSPSGDCFLSATIRIPSGVGFVGQGSLNTRFRRTGDYGHTFDFGTVFNLGGGVTVQAYNASGGAGGFCVYQDHGTGMFPPNTVAGGFTNLATHGAHINIERDFNVKWFDMLIIGMPYQVRRFGGLQARHECVTTIGVYDQAVPAMQECLAGWLIQGDLSTIPTDLEFDSCRIGGITSPIRPITLPSGNVITDSVQNCGPLFGMQIECAEGIRWRGGYIGACADSGLRLLADPASILSAVSFEQMFVDSNGYAGFFIDRRYAGTTRDFTWHPSEHNCQGNGWCAGTDEIRFGANPDKSGYPSVIGFNLSGMYQTFIAFGVWLDAARSLKCDINARCWNCRGFFNALPNFDCFLRLGGGGTGACGTIMGGGGQLGDGTASHDVCVIRYTTNGLGSNPTNVHITGANGVGTPYFMGSNA